MHNSDNPIGIFDSGIGGISIWKEIRQLMPNENSIYLADSKNAPYGNKSKDEIRRLSEKNTEILLARNCKMVVVACNTATTNSIKHLRDKYAVPFIGIEPAIKPASLKTKTKSIGILATKGTLASDLFHEANALYGKEVQIVEQVGTGLVKLIEENKIESKEMTDLLLKYINPMIKANIDHLVLGCSHYPFLIPRLKLILPKSVKIIDSGEAVAKQTWSILKDNDLLNQHNTAGESSFYSNSDLTTLEALINNQGQVQFLDF